MNSVSNKGRLSRRPLLGFITCFAAILVPGPGLATPSLATSLRRNLDMAATAQAGQTGFLSAASGLVKVGDKFYVVADDENQLAIFTADQRAPGRFFQLVAGDLPLAKEARKQAKPDYETLMPLSKACLPPNGGLFALPSGSTSKRNIAVIIPFSPTQELLAPRLMVMAPLFAALKKHFPALNIEGAAFADSQTLRLFQRGNGKQSRNATVAIDGRGFCQALGQGATLAKAGWLRSDSIRDYDLGELKGVRLAFSDAAALPGGLIAFTASAEDSIDAYHDGKTTGSVVGVMAADGSLLGVRPIDRTLKVEGIWPEATGKGEFNIWLVTDADDPKQPAILLSATLSTKTSAHK